MWLWLSLALASPLKLDIGGPHSAVMPGFEAVTRDGSAHASWTVVPNVIEVGVYPDALSDNAKAGILRVEGEGTWLAVRVAIFSEGAGGRRGSGTWTVSVDGRVQYSPRIPTNIEDFLASEYFAPVRRPVFREGESAWERSLVHQKQWVELQVPDAPVDISVIGREWDAVIRASSSAELRQAIAETDEAARLDYLAHHDRTARVPLPTGGDGVEVAHWGVSPDPDAAAPNATWQLEMSRSEVGGGVVWVHGSDEPVEVAWVPTRGLQVELSEPVWYDSRGRPAVDARPQPAVLEPLDDGRALGGQGMPVGVGVLLRVDDDAPVGRHSGALQLTQGSRAWTVPVDLRVLPIALDPPIPTGPFLSMNLFLARWTGVGSPQSLANIDHAMDMLARRGLTAIGLQNAMFGLGGRGVDLSVVRHVVDGWESRGGAFLNWTDVKRDLRTDAMYDSDGVVLSQQNIDRTREMLAGVSGTDMVVQVAMTEEEGWKSADAVYRAVDYLQLVRTFTPSDVLLSGHVGHALGWSLAPYLDTMTWSGHPDETWENTQRATQGVPLVAYNFGAGRGAALRAWHLEAIAHLEWQFADEPIDPFASIETRRTTTFGVLSPSGIPWSTPWLERFAKGVHDARYVATLDRWTQRPRCETPEVDAARAWLDQLHENLEVADGASSFGGDTWTGDAFDDVRELTIDHLLAVGRSCGGLLPRTPVPSIPLRPARR